MLSDLAAVGIESIKRTTMKKIKLPKKPPSTETMNRRLRWPTINWTILNFWWSKSRDCSFYSSFFYRISEIFSLIRPIIRKSTWSINHSSSSSSARLLLTTSRKTRRKASASVIWRVFPCCLTNLNEYQHSTSRNSSKSKIVLVKRVLKVCAFLYPCSPIVVNRWRKSRWLSCTIRLKFSYNKKSWQ